MSLDDLLLAGLRGGEDLAALEGLSPDEWRLLVSLARGHGVLPLLHHRMASSGRAVAVPPDVAAAMRREYLGTAARNLKLYRGLAEVLTALDARGIPVIALKGAHLAQLVYPSVALRPMADIDLLVRRDDLSAAMTELQRLGYLPYHGLHVEPDELEAQHLPPMVKPGAVAIELHWTIVHPMDSMRRHAGPFAIDLDALWARAETVTLAGAPARVLAPADLLIHLSVHFTQHHAFRTGLKAICDVAMLVDAHRAHGLDWAGVRDLAQAWRARRCVFLTLALARDLLATPIPDDVLGMFAPSTPAPAIVSEARRVALEPAQLVSARVSRIWQARRWREKVRGLLIVAFPKHVEMASMYPVEADSWRVYLYYPVRFKDLLVRHAGRLWRLARREPEAVAWADHERRKAALVDWLGGQD